MAIVVTCTCGKQFKVKEDLAGKRGKCAACGRVVSVPTLAPVLDQEKASPSSLRACPTCHESLQPNAVICLKCGVDLRKGQRLPHAKSSAPAAPPGLPAKGPGATLTPDKAVTGGDSEPPTHHNVTQASRLQAIFNPPKALGPGIGCLTAAILFSVGCFSAGFLWLSGAWFWIVISLGCVGVLLTLGCLAGPAVRDVSEKDRKALQDLITQTDPAAKPQLLNLLEEKALESGDAALWELVLDNGTTTKHWPLYFRALQSGHWALQHKASDRLIIANHEDDYRLMESRFEAQARELLAGIEATLRQGSGYHVCYPLIYFAGNQHASLSLSYAEQEKLLHKREKPQKPEGALCKGAKALLLQIQEGHFGKAVQSDLEEHFKKSLMTQAATEESFRKLGIIK